MLQSVWKALSRRYMNLKGLVGRANPKPYTVCPNCDKSLRNNSLWNNSHSCECLNPGEQSQEGQRERESSLCKLLKEREMEAVRTQKGLMCRTSKGGSGSNGKQR